MELDSRIHLMQIAFLGARVFQFAPRVLFFVSKLFSTSYSEHTAGGDVFHVVTELELG